MASTQRAHILIPRDLLREIDDLVGPRGRSAFLLETARQEVQRRKLLRFLDSEQPAWRAQDHPELADGAAMYVQQLRRQSENRGAPRHRDRSPSPGQRRANSVRESSSKASRTK
jgi:hypothetical protein